MTRHGGSRSLKRLNTPKFLQIKRKHGKFFITPSPGPHPSRFCLPLLHIVRDLLEIVDNYREAKKLIGLGNFKVDGKVVKDRTFPVGLMDVLSIVKTNKHYRILPDSHHGLILHEIPEAESTFKLCRITQKTTLKGGNIQLNLHDGRNIFISVKDPKNPKEDIYKRMDVLKITIPEQEILKVLKFKEGNLAIIMSGKNIGQLGKVLTILKRFGPKASTVSIQHNSEHTETLYDYTFIIGEGQSEINLPKSE
ncbi:MAG TPA: 30S ribosomal protein S4e [Candidatus Nanopelagicaceae bacterium]|nr:30S ribosomal protein S4e [Candidatus Nanopelagicaceae bacterium]